MNKTITIESLYQTFRSSTIRITLSTKLQRTSTNKHYSKVAESENIRANHLGFTKSLFQYYCQHLRLNYNYISAKSVFNFYVNEKISSLLGTPVNTKSARETFYRELIQNTNLPTNHNFASIITEINKEIEYYTQQRYPITYASKGKEKLQTPAVTPKRIQPPIWKKTRAESPTAPSYHYTPGSAINITSASVSISNAILTIKQFPFQRIQLLLPQLDFGTITLWELSEEKEEKELEDQEFTYQNLILENLEFETPNVQTHTAKSKPQIIIINQPPVEPIGQPIQILNQQTQQPPPVPPQQQQQLLPQQQQQMAYASIAKLNKFTGKKDDTQVWLNNVEKAIAANGWNNARAMQVISYFLKNTADSWYQSLIDKLQDFNAFKLEFLRYFSNNNSINRLANTFITIKQRETEAVTTYLGHFHRNLQQIQAIDANYFTAPQILNQFIRGLCITYARDFKSAKLEANHAHAVNLVMNGSSELDFKLKQTLPQNSVNMTSGHLKPRITQNWRLAMIVHQLISSSFNSPSELRSWNSGTGATQNLNSQNYLSLLVIPEDATNTNLGSNQQLTLTSNIPPATVTEDKLLAAISPFEIEEPSEVSLFNRVTIEEKPITAIYTDAKINGHFIKLILDSRRVDHVASAKIITADGATKTPIGEINNLPIEINSITVPIKILVMEATQYQALVGNNWLFKTNAILD
ncbi:hypothetical protein G9A89_006233 [Geosiphon pyriformis]|nr:hypothetical protein G9A89_006233 [Geosiphon pyriformis]